MGRKGLSLEWSVIAEVWRNEDILLTETGGLGETREVSVLSWSVCLVRWRIPEGFCPGVGLCLAFWMTGSSQEGRLASWEANCGGLHVRSWWGGKEERDALQTTPSETVTSCVRGAERKWLHIPGMASYVSGYWDYSENAGRSELVWGVPGDIYLERIGWQSVAEQSLLRLTPKLVPIGRSSAGTPTSVPVMYREGC